MAQSRFDQDGNATSKCIACGMTMLNYGLYYLHKGPYCYRCHKKLLVLPPKGREK